MKEDERENGDEGYKDKAHRRVDEYAEPEHAMPQEGQGVGSSSGKMVSAAPSSAKPSPTAPARAKNVSSGTLAGIAALAKGRAGGALGTKRLTDLSVRLSRINAPTIGRLPESPVDRYLREMRTSTGELAYRTTSPSRLRGLSIVEDYARRQRDLERSLGTVGTLASIARGHSALAESVSAVGGIASIMKRHQQLETEFGKAGLSARTGGLGSAARTLAAIEQATRSLAGVTSFTGLLGRGQPDRESIDKLLSGTLDWQRAGRAGSLSSTLSRRLPELFPERRRATSSDLVDMVLGRTTERFLRDGRRLGQIRDEMLGIRRPWVEVDRPERSVAAFVQARALATVVADAPAESRAVVQAVRADLGDFRDVGPVPEEVSADLVLSSAFRLDVGFNPDLGSLPPAVMAAVFGFRGRIAKAGEVDPDALESVVHQRARRLELRLRRFIERQMIGKVGPRWEKTRVRQETLKRWRQRRQLDLDNGRRPSRLFDYAGFEDYREIIERSDNWREVFKGIFPVQTSLLEALRRLSLIRNPDAHYRVMTIDDLLDLTVEGRRLDQWMDAAA